jgi:nucleoside 2-deoxyribosyltransferase
MRVYLAAGISSRASTLKKANELRGMGIEVTSRWLNETGSNLIEYADIDTRRMAAHATRDVQDISRADMLVRIASPVGHRCRGCGRHWETGYAYANDKPIMVVGHIENVFDALPSAEEYWAWSGIRVVETWDEAKTILLKLATEQLPAWLVSPVEERA